MSNRSGLAWSWTLIVLAICWFPGYLLPAKETGDHAFLIPHLDKMVHFGIFAIFAILWLRVAPTAGRAARVFLSGLALAIVTELGQESSIIGRDGDWIDGLADVLGVAAGLLAYHLRPRVGGATRDAATPR